MNDFLSGVSRDTIVRMTAIYLLVYAVVNACGGIVFGLAGGLFAGVGAMTAASGIEDAELTAASTSLAALGGLTLGLGLLYLVSVPVFGIAAWGLFRRKAWARMGAIVALVLSIILSVLTLNNGLGGVIWILISGFAIYLFYSDAGIKQELSR